MKSFCKVALPSALLLAACAGCDSSKKGAAATPPAATTSPATPAAVTPLRVEETAQVTVTATVKAVDQATRVVTLKGATGEEVTFVVDPRVKRLNEVAIGDEVTANYSVSLVGELRPPTAEEQAHPIMAIDAAGRAGKESSPAAGGVLAMRAVTTVEAIDLPNMRVTLKGPMGDLAVIRAKKPENVKRLRVGDTIIVTYTEAMAIALEKKPAAK